MIKKLILGTVQFGLNYGINNLSGKPSKKEVFEILDVASEQKIESLDTADAYGDSMEQIGKYHQQEKYRFKILGKFGKVKKGDLINQAKDSLNLLYVPNFEVYSYHSFADYVNYPYLKHELRSLKTNGLTNKIGISVYSNEELQKVLCDKDIDVIQLPYNLLDNHNLRGSYLDLAKVNKKEIHTRSVFLQGLFFKDLATIPEKLAPLKSYICEIRSYCLRESVDLLSFALNYVVYNKQIDNVLIGVDTKDQLIKNIESLKEMTKAFDFINQHINIKETELLNPTNWK